MELNTQYWGEGVHANSGWLSMPNDFKIAGRNGTAKNLSDLRNDGILELNKHIDSSAYWCYSWNSKISNYATAAYNSTSELVVTRSNNTFANYIMGIPVADRQNILAPYELRFRIGLGVTDSSITLPTFYALTRYALSRIRACCYVRIVRHSTDTSMELPDAYSFSVNQTMSLQSFINSNYYSEYLNDTIRVVGMYWELYMSNTESAIVKNNYSNIRICAVNDIYPIINVPYNYVGQYFGVETSTGIYQGGIRSVGTSSSDFQTYLFAHTSDNWNIQLARYSESTSNRIIVAYLPPENLWKAFHEFAYTGLYYTDNTTTAANATLRDSHLWLGKMSPITGSTNGQYIQFSEDMTDDEAEAASIEANPATTTDTDPEADPNPSYAGGDSPDSPTVDPNTYITATPLASPKLSTVDVFNRTFAMTAVQIRALADFLWNADDDKMTEIIEGMALYGENPLNGLINCRLYPFDLTPLSSSGERIIIGRVTTDVYGRKMQNDATYVMDLGSCKFKKYFDNFLDYSPYTTARLFLPYCGMVPVDTAEFMGHEISAKLIVDVITGVCCCCIYRDDILIVTANGVCGCEISMTGTDSASYSNAMINQFANATLSVAGGVGSLAGGATLAKTGASNIKYFEDHANRLTDTRILNEGLSQESSGLRNMGSGVGSIASGITQFWNLQHTPTQYAQRGSSSPSCETWLPQYPFFIIDSPITDIPEGYGHNVGYACAKTGTLSSFTGYTICSNVDTSGFAQATQSERDELKTLLESGVFL